MSILSVDSLVFRYSENGEDVLKNLSFEVEQGDFVAVLGHNGSGKSTLAKMFNGILVSTSGKIVIDGIDTACEETVSELRKTVGMVFQNPDNQLVSTIVEEEVAFALENQGVPYEEMRRRVDEAIEAVGMSEYKTHATHKLSGGQKQRIAIAGVIVSRPKLLVLDEPTAMLDPQGRKEVMEIVRKLNRDGITVIMITHYMDEAAQANRIIVMNSGEILLDGDPHYVFQNGGLLKSVGLDVPQSTELMFALRKGGLRVPLSVLTVDECFTVLEDVLAGRIDFDDQR